MPAENIKSSKIVEIKEYGKSVFYRINDSVEREINKLEEEQGKFAGMDMPMILSNLMEGTGYEKEKSILIIDECVGLVRKRGKMLKKYTGKADISYNIKKRRPENDINYLTFL